MTIASDAPCYIGAMLAQESALLRLPDPYPTTIPVVRPAAVGSLADLTTEAPTLNWMPERSLV